MHSLDKIFSDIHDNQNLINGIKNSVGLSGAVKFIQSYKSIRDLIFVLNNSESAIYKTVDIYGQWLDEGLDAQAASLLVALINSNKQLAIIASISAADKPFLHLTNVISTGFLLERTLQYD